MTGKTKIIYEGKINTIDLWLTSENSSSKNFKIVFDSSKIKVIYERSKKMSLWSSFCGHLYLPRILSALMNNIVIILDYFDNIR